MDDPRVSKPRLPKAYTEEQLVFLRSHISGFESRTRGHVRGDAKKFALDRASEFLVRFGLPPDLQGVDEAEPRFREVSGAHLVAVACSFASANIQLVQEHGRAGEAEACGAHEAQEAVRQRCVVLGWLADLLAHVELAGSISWSPTIATLYTGPSDAPDPSSHAHPPQPQPQQQQQQQQQQPQPGPSGQQLPFTFQTAVQVPSPSQITLSVTPAALRDAFITPAIDLPSLSSLIQSYVLAHPSATPFTPVIHALFDAASAVLASSASAGSTSASASGPGSVASATPSGGTGQARTDALCALLRRFVDACAYFPNTLVHADVSGPLAGPRALQTALRKSSVWAPLNASLGSGSGMGTGTPHGSLSDEMERIKVDRQRRKDHVQWAQIHAAAIELGIVGCVTGTSTGSPNPAVNVNVPVPVGVGAGMGVVATNGNAAYHRPGQAQDLGYAVDVPSTDTFSEMMARDAVWEADEVEWVAGIIVLRALIRTAGAHRKGELERLLGAYERRWKEIRDEARQALVTVRGHFCCLGGWVG